MAMIPLGAAPSAFADSGYSDAAETGAENVLRYNEQNVACLANTSFKCERSEDGEPRVTVPADDWSLAAMGADREYIAFANAGAKLDPIDPRLGEVDIDGDVETYVMRLVDASLSEDGESVVFSGQDVSAADLQHVYSASGAVGCDVDDSAVAEALSTAEFEGDDEVDSAVVDMPEVDEESIDAWVASLEGTLELQIYRYGYDTDAASAGKSIEASFDSSKYEGFYQDIHPLGGDEESDGSQALDDLGCVDAWLVDGDGFLWYIGADKTLSFYGSPFEAIAENAFNENAVTELTASGEQMARKLAQRAPSLHVDPRVAVKTRGFAATTYIKYDIDEVYYSPSEERRR